MTSLAIFQKADLTTLRDPRLFREFAYVGGAWTRGSGNLSIDVTDPADGSRVGCVPAMTVSDTTEAIEIAYRAFVRWS